MKRVEHLLLAVFFSFLAVVASATADEKKEGPLVIHRIALDPRDPRILYAVTSNYGVLKSSDGGMTWELSNQGLDSYTHHAVVVNPLRPDVVYVGSWSSGISKSLDRGAHWTGVNGDLGNTAIEDLTLDPTTSEILYAATTSGVFKSLDGGNSWRPYSEGLPVAQIDNFQCLLASPSGPIELFLGTSHGLFKRESNAPAWEAVSSGIARGESIIALAYEPKSHLYYAGTIKHGLLRSQDGGKHWAPLGGGIEKTWISDLALDPRHSGIIYASTRGNGILKSDDGGATWREMNSGLPVKDIRSLAIDPLHPEILYAGTTLDGIFKTRDGGQLWFPLKGYPVMTNTEIIASLSLPPRRPSAASTPSIPPAFSKCNRCHGWADPLLNMKRTYWRVPPNRRDWTVTVARMGPRAHLTPEEAKTIAEFLTQYTQGNR
jgi:photosystem II stability/assembly factor-like uncharacterized protein